MNPRSLLYLLLAVGGLVLLTVTVERAGRRERSEPHAHEHSSPASSANQGGVGASSASGASGGGLGGSARAINTDHPGYALYKSKGCGQCHGIQLQGTRLAPALVDLGRYWDAERLAAYMRDPKAMIASDERLKELDQQFRMGMMPPFDLPTDEMESLTSFLLSPAR
jgi:hypothetical protein